MNPTVRFALPVILSAALAACGLSAPPAGDPAPFSPTVAQTPPVSAVQSAVAEAVMPAIVAVRETIAESLAPDLPASPLELVHRDAVALIVAFEVSGRAHYERRLQGPICPGGASGPTIGIGDDLGHQTPTEIRRRWSEHPDVERLVTAAGQIGDARCRAWRAEHGDIRVPWDKALEVFRGYALTAYHGAASRALRDGWDGLPQLAQGAAVSLGYNRGWSMLGESRREMRTLRDDCVPAVDVQCQAAALRAMCRIWAGQPIGPGLCRRRHAEADLTVRET